MTGRVQSIRSNVSGTRPTGRQPGELYVNWADGQIGSVNSVGGAQDLVGVRFFSTAANYVIGDFVVQGGQLYRAIAPSTGGAFVPTNWTQLGGSITINDAAPANPQPGQLWWDSVGGQLYVWYADANTAQWVIAVNVANLLTPASKTTLGVVKVDGTTINAAPDGTISVATPAMNDNRIINGDMRINQRGVTNGTASGYTCDRWNYQGAQPSKITWQQGTAGAPAGFPYYLFFSSNSAYAPVAADYFQFLQPIEADIIGDLAWGTASAQLVTLSFLVSSSLTGTFSGAIGNGSRTYPFTYAIPISGVWTKIVITIPGDTTGTWAMSGNAAGFTLVFDLGGSTTYRAPANAWVSGNYIGANGAVSLVATNGATLALTGVKLEVGNVATPFNRQSLAKSLADCQRYYETAFFDIGFPSYAVGSTTRITQWYRVNKRAAPTIVLTPGSLVGANAAALASSGIDGVSLQVGSTIIATFVEAQGVYTASAEL